MRTRLFLSISILSVAVIASGCSRHKNASAVPTPNRAGADDAGRAATEREAAKLREESDRAEAAQIMGRDPVTKEIGADGKEHVTQVAHWWRVYQRNVPEYGSGSAVAPSGEGAAARPAERP